MDSLNQTAAQQTGGLRVCPTCSRQFHAGDASSERCPSDGSTTIVVSSDKLVNQIACGKYRIVSLLGVGAWSEVYKAVNVSGSGPEVAIKILHVHLAADPLKVARFNREADMLMHLKHRCFAQVYEQGLLDGGRPCLVMEYLVGLSLETYLAEVGRMTVSQANELFLPVCDALAGAHDKGLIHRDLKPSNLFLVEKNGVLIPRILDFGLAKMNSLDSGGALASLTQSGEILGTPAYMSPEQCLGNVLDARSDLYSLGCMIYEALTNHRAIAGKTAFEAMSNQIGRMPASIREVCPEASVSEHVEAVIFRLLEKQPDDRFDNAREFAAAFQTASSGSGDQLANVLSAPVGTVPTNPKQSMSSSPASKSSPGAKSISAQTQSSKSSASAASADPARSSSSASLTGDHKSLLDPNTSFKSFAKSQAAAKKSLFADLGDLKHPLVIVTALIFVVGAGTAIFHMTRAVDTMTSLPARVPISKPSPVTDVQNTMNSAADDYFLRKKIQMEPQITILDLSGRHFSKEVLPVLATAKSLKTLSLSSCEGVGDQTIFDIDKLKLTGLCLDGTDVTDQGVQMLSEMKQLSALSLARTPIDDAVCKIIADNFEQMSFLCFSGTSLSDNGIAALAKLKKVHHLYLNTTKVGKGILLLNHLPLVLLNLQGASLTDEIVEALNFPDLETLDLSNTKITNKSLVALAKRPKLKKLFIRECSNLTADGIIDFNTAVKNQHRMVKVILKRDGDDAKLDGVVDMISK